MRYLIIIPLLMYYILFVKDVKAAFTRETCIDCCKGLSANQSNCEAACIVRFSHSQDYNSREECNRTCVARFGGCRDRCYDDCTERYEPGIPGMKPATRLAKAKRERAQAYHAEARYYDPNKPKKKIKKKKGDEAGSSTG